MSTFVSVRPKTPGGTRRLESVGGGTKMLVTHERGEVGWSELGGPWWFVKSTATHMSDGIWVRRDGCRDYDVSVLPS